MKRAQLRRRIGTVLVVLGAVALVYGATVYVWRDPVTDLYARWKQHQLAGDVEELFAQYRANPLPQSSTEPGALEPGSSPPADDPNVVGRSPVDEQAIAAGEMRAAAAAMYRKVKKQDGRPLGRLIIPRLGIDPVFVNGTRWGADLSRGPGRYPETFLPGMGRVTAIAGHRTTFGAPFRHIDRLRAGDVIEVELPYGLFTYRVVEHEIVDNGDWSILEPRGYDTLVLSACHPLYSASHRWVVFAQLETAELSDGLEYAAGDLPDLPGAPQAAAG